MRYLAVSLGVALFVGLASSECVRADAGLDFGVGVNTATGQPRSRCVRSLHLSESPPDLSGLATQHVDFQYEAVESVEKLRDLLEISANSSVRGLWGTASASTSYLSSTEVNSYQLFMLIRARVLGAPILTQATPDDAALSENGRPLTAAEVFTKCGDAFVSAIQYGGSIDALLVVDTRSQEETNRLRLALSAKLSVGVEGDVNVQHSVEHVLQNNHYHFRLYQEGGGKSVGFPDNATISSFFAWAHAFEAEIKAKPVVMEVELQPITSVYPRLSAAPAQDQRDALRRLADLWANSTGRRQNLTFIARYPYRFGIDDPANFVKAGEDVAEFSKEVVYRADDCYRDSKFCGKEAIQGLLTTWKQLNSTLPVQEPLYNVFDFRYQWTPRDIHRNEGCVESWTWTSFDLGDLEITPDKTSLNYYFKCERRGFFYNCGGGNDTTTPDPTPTWIGKVTAKLDVRGGIVHVFDVKTLANGGIDPFEKNHQMCSDSLKNFITSRNGAIVR